MMATPTSYTVKAGDTLSMIARNVLRDVNRWPEIARLNALRSPYTIRVGQVLTLPSVPSAVASPAPVPVLSSAWFGLREVQSRLTTLQAQLVDLANQIGVKRQQLGGALLPSNDPLLIRYRALSAEAARLRQQVSRSEAPSQLLVNLDTFSDRVLEVGKQIGEFPAGLGAAFRNLPLIIGGLAVLAVVAFLWANRKR